MKRIAEIITFVNPCAESRTITSVFALIKALTLSSKPLLAPTAAPTSNFLFLTFFTSKT